jgi:hypothetical protein
MSLYSDTLSSFQAKRYILTPLYGMLSGEAANTNLIVYFDPTRSQTTGKHTNHYHQCWSYDTDIKTSELLTFNIKWDILQLDHGISYFVLWDDDDCFVLHQHIDLAFYSANGTEIFTKNFIIGSILLQSMTKINCHGIVIWPLGTLVLEHWMKSLKVDTLLKLNIYGSSLFPFWMLIAHYIICLFTFHNIL